MNISDSNAWTFNTISEILHALAKKKEIRETLIFKGAFILGRYFRTGRKSLDIDSNFTAEFVSCYPSRVRQISLIKEYIKTALSDHFEMQDPARYKLKNLNIVEQPHPFGWGGLRVFISIDDYQKLGVRGLPNLVLDIAAPESLSPNSTSLLTFRGSKINAYSLERIAGEKARAYLSTLESYEKKIGQRKKPPRVRDLYDLARILGKKPIENKKFWDCAGREFKLACESRYVDCRGIKSFLENWTDTKKQYSISSIIPKDISADEAKSAIKEICQYWSKSGVTPFSFQLLMTK